jgi:hypothetical protein
MGRVDVQAMLREMTSQQLMDWIAYSGIEPFGAPFDDARSAQIVQTLANIHRDTKRYPKPLDLDRFLLANNTVAKPQNQTWQEKKAILKQMAMAFTPPEKPKLPERKRASQKS